MPRQPVMRQAEKGQSLVEMTVGMVILLIIVMGILDLGRVYFTYLTLQDAAGEAALYLAVDPCCSYPPEGEGVSGGCSNPNNARYRAAYSADSNFAQAIWNLGEDGFQAQVDNPLLIGSPISVAVSYPYQPLTPLISAMVPHIRLRASASNVVTLAALSCS